MAGLGGARRAAALVVGALLLAGCGGAADDGPSTSGSAGPSGSPAPPASGSPSASASALTDASGRVLTEAEAQAFREATDVVVAYRQTVIDLLSGARTNLNDLNEVVSGNLLQDDLKNMQQSLSAGRRTDAGSQVVLVAASPVDVRLTKDPATVRVRACIDLTGITFTQPDGTTNRGTRGQADYVVTRTTYLPAPGWAVTEILINDEASTC